MLESILTTVIGANWEKFLPAVVGLVAIFLYILQEYRKKKDAAALIVLQISELKNRITEFQPYIYDSGINDKNFYESLPFIKTNYWENYKHLFVNEIDVNSYNSIEKFYKYVEIIQEQQDLVKNLLKDYFFHRQKIINDARMKFIENTLKEVDSTAISSKQYDELLKHLPLSPENEQTKQIFSLILRQLQQQNPNIDMQRFWKIYANKNEWLINVTNQNALSICIPLQVVETLKIILKQYSSLEIVAQEGYKELSNLAGITKTRVGIVTFFKWIL